VVIEAVRWLATDLSYKKVCEFVGQQLPYNDEEGQLTIATREGDMIASERDWIIRGVKGEYYPCKPDIFEASYEPAE
jgi:hypothetical protein